MIFAVFAALAGLRVEVPPTSYEVGDCFEVELTIRNTSKRSVDVGLGAPVVTVLQDGERAPGVGRFNLRACDGDGPRVLVEPGTEITWTYRGSPLFLEPGEVEIVLDHQDLGEIDVAVEVSLPEEHTVEWFAMQRLEPTDGRFEHPYYIDALAALARQGVEWPVEPLMRMREEPGVAAVLAELRDHPLPGIRRAAALPRPFEPTRADTFAPPPSDARLLEILETTEDPDVANVVTDDLDRRVPAALRVLYERLGRCESQALLIHTRGWAFDIGERHVVGPLLLPCLEVRETRGAAVAGLLHYVAWYREKPCGDFDVDAAREAWTEVFTRHHDAIAAGRQLPTWADGVPEAAKSLGCPVRPSVRR